MVKIVKETKNESEGFTLDNMKKLQDGLQTAYINKSYNSNLAYRPEFISNDYKKGKKVLSLSRPRDLRS